jgi:MATE family multidrug resistance protein
MDGGLPPCPPLTGPQRRALWRSDLVDLLRLAAPVVGARLGIMTMGLSDAVVVGRYSARELGYHALGWAPTSVVVTMLVGFLAGAQVMAARAYGEGRPEITGAVLRRALVYALWISAAATVLFAVLGPPGLAHAGLAPDLARGAGRVLVVFSLSLIPYGVSCAASFWLEGIGRPHPGMWLMWAANLINLAVDLVLVPGRFGVHPMGALGGAWATFCARTFLSIALLAWIALMPDARRLGVFTRAPRDLAAETEQRRVGYGAGASNAFEVTAFASLNLFAGWIGGFAVAAWTVALNVGALVFMIPLGLGTATAVVVGRAYGAMDPQGVRRGGQIAFAVASVFGILVSLAIWPASGFIASLYTADVSTRSLATGALALACLFFWPDALQTVAAQALRARGDLVIPSTTHLISYVLVMTPLAWVLALPLRQGVDGLMEAVIVASFLAAGFLLARFWLMSRRDASAGC